MWNFDHRQSAEVPRSEVELDLEPEFVAIGLRTITATAGGKFRDTLPVLSKCLGSHYVQFLSQINATDIRCEVVIDQL